MTAAVPLFRSSEDHLVASVRRGVCPSLTRPMQTGDGLLVRLRPASGGFSPDSLAAIAEAARRYGNGILEVTARGNLQIRGLKPETVEPLTRDVFATGIDLAMGLTVETPPLAGIDGSEICDARPLAARLRAAVAAEPEPLQLAAKLSVIVDGGGIFNLDAIVADIRLTAFRSDDGLLWALALGGDGTSTRSVGAFTEDGALTAVLTALRQLDRMGNSARGRDLDIAALGLSGQLVPDRPGSVRMRRPAGLHRLADGRTVAGVGLAFRQVRAEALAAFARSAADLDVTDIRLAPEHGLLVAGLDDGQAAHLLAEAESLGFLVSTEDPANAIALCSGTAGCASAFYDTHALAKIAVDTASDLLDGSFMLHLSGCAKGCAHPASAPISVSGASLGYGVVVNGSASASPAAYIAANEVASALMRLNRLMRSEKQAAESAHACIGRLGVERIAAVLQQEE